MFNVHYKSKVGGEFSSGPLQNKSEVIKWVINTNFTEDGEMKILYYHDAIQQTEVIPE